MSHKISEALSFALGGVSADISTPYTTPAYVDMSGARRVLAHCVTGTIAQTETLTVQLVQATDAGGTASKALGDPVVVTAPTGGAALSGVAEAMAEDMDLANGFTHVGATVTASDGTVVAGVSVVRGDLRFSP
ncbi:hypothetical protein JN531_012215 [Flagellatimonas centrodinii]|uniref:hypothetical protein n=1 Tax=Flagellatimonas centrodinii TaxID=2806210 RepID=UPI001FEF19FF|nr:hypothetical protein [Flagellatimonas centrodinii]ULQ45865.1 hypothetical protein JN531_012215 [Flagellatimonas centrodinii]